MAGPKTAGKYPEANGNTTAMATADAPKTLDEATQAQTAGFISQASVQDLNERMLRGDLESAPMLFTIEEGQQVTAEIITDGEATIEDVATRQMKTVKNWTIQLLHPTTYVRGPKVSILGSAQLDRMLPSLLGCVVVIARGGTGKTAKGRQLTEWFVALDKLCPENKPRLPIVDIKATEAR